MGSTRGRLVVPIAVAVFGTGVALAVTDTGVVSPRTIDPKGEVYPALGEKNEAATPEQGVLGAARSARETRPAEDQEDDDKRKRRDAAADEVGEAAVLAAMIPAGSGGGGVALPCSDTGSCMNRVGRLITDTTERLPALPALRKCISSVGGDAMCFDFGGGAYLLGDGPADGKSELGFCTGSGYYHVSGPFLGGGVDTVCPGERLRGRERRSGRRNPPTTYNCESLSGGRAICYDLGRGNYIVSDSPADGRGEFGFCGESGYYYVSAPSGKGEAGVECPGARGDLD